LGRSGNSSSAADVGNDDGDFDTGETAFANGLGNGEEVGAAAGEQDS
jgi:hypothetical protein